MTFENTVARFRIICEHVEKLQSDIEAFKGEAEMLETEIINAALADPSLFNSYVRKNESAGVVGRNFFKVHFSKTLMRRGATDRLDDQDWLEGLDEQYIREKKSLSAAKIKDDYAAGVITDAALTAMDLKYGDKVSVLVSYIPTDEQANALMARSDELLGNSEE